MASKFTFELPDDLRELMDEHPEVNWSAVFRQAARRHVDALEVANEILDEQADPRVQAVAEALEEGTGQRFREAREGAE